MRKYLKFVGWGLLGLLLLAQAIRPEKNLSNDQAGHISRVFPVPDSVEAILKVACYDCHSNYTRYPWYAEVQPVAAWLADHVEEGKSELNFSAFTQRRAAVQNHKMEEVIEQVREGEMPLASYTWVHRDAILDARQKQLLIDWAQAGMDWYKAHYPPDSLVLRRR